MNPSILLRRSAAAFSRPASPATTANLTRKPITSHNFSTSSIAMGVHNITSKQDYLDAVKQDGLMVLDAFATWCGPCKIISPKIVEYSDKYPDVRFYKFDVDEVPEVAQELGIRAMPTFTFFKGGDKIHEVVGANPSAIEAGISSNK